MVTLLEARGEDADHPLVPVRLEQAQAERHRLQWQILELGQGFTLHTLLDRLAVLVQLIQLPGHFPRQVGVVTEQAFDTQAHVVQTTGGVQARAEDEAEVSGGDACMITPRHLKDGLEPGPGPPCPDPLKALMYEDAVVGVQGHDVSNTAQGDQIEQFADIRLWRVVVMPEAAQACAQGHQHVENHPDPGQRLARELAAGLVGIDDGIGCRQFMTWQVMIGDQHLQPGSFGCGHTLYAGNTVVHGNQQLRLAFQGNLNDFRGQAITVFETIGHQVIDMRRPQQTQTQHPYSAGGRAIGIEVANDQDALALGQGLDQQVYRCVDTFELLVRQQACQAFVQFRRTVHATGGVQPGQQRRQVAKKRQGVRQGAWFDAHNVSRARPAATAAALHADHGHQ
ncbi:hypothetical protein D9M71_364590 [compost metagenome]